MSVEFVAESKSSIWSKAFGWLVLLTLIVFLASLVDSEYLDPSSHQFIFLIGIVGIWRYSNNILHYIRGMYFQYWAFPKLRKLADKMGDKALPSHIFMVVTSFRIPPETTYKVYQSIFQELCRIPVPSTIIASIVEAGDEYFIKQIMREEIKHRPDISLVIVRARGTGKRDGLAHAFRALSRRAPTNDAVACVVDGDTMMLPGCVDKACRLFALLPNVGGMTTNEYCIVKGGRLLTSWHNMRFVQRHINMCSMSLSHQVLTLTGRLSFFRASLMTDHGFIKDVEADFLQHWRLGKFQFLTGDDKSSWFSLKRAGWDTFYVPDSYTLTVEHPPSKYFLKATRQLMFRWYGNSLRQNFRAVKLLRQQLGLFTLYVLYDQRVSMWTSLFGLAVAIIASLLISIQFIYIYFLWILITRSIVCILFIFSKHPVDPLYPFALYYNQIIGSMMKINAVFHLDRQQWTRQKTTLNQNISFDTKLNRWTSKIAMLSAIAIFLCIVSLAIDVNK